MDKNETPKNIDSFEQIIASLDKIGQNIKACMDSPDSKNVSKDDMLNMMSSMYDSMYASIRYVHDRIDDVHKRMDKHSVNHLPPIIGPEKMNKALAALGLDGDYQCEKRTIYATKQYNYDAVASKGNAKQLVFELKNKNS